MSGRTWTNEDFDAMSWHDVHVHGFRLVDFREGEGSCDLVFDIDYILEWVEVGPGRPLSFEVAQASLRFHDVSGLRVALDYATPGAGMCALSLDGVSRDKLESRDDYEWTMEVNWPAGKIAFEASGFTQVLVGPVITQSAQSLAGKDRV